MMKDSGVAWIGEIPDNWKVLPAQRGFREVKRKNTDGAIQKALQFKFGVIIPKANFDADDDDYVADTILTYTIVEPGTVMINGLNLNYDFKTQRTGLVRETGVITSAYLALWPNQSLITPEFATYLLKGYETRMALHNMGAGIRLTLGFKEFKKQPVLFPPLSEQSRIAAFLDSRCAEIDRVIAATQSTIEEYKKLKQSIITEAVTHGVRGPRKMKDSGVEWIGEIPEEWDIVYGHRIVVNTQNGLTRRDLDESVGQIVLKLKNITADGKIDYTVVNRIALTEEELARYSLADGDFLFVRVNGSKALVGKCAIFSDQSESIAYNDHIIRVRLNDLIQKRYFQLYLQSAAGRVEIDLRTSTAAGQFTISGEGLRDLQVTLPPIEEQGEIVNYLNRRCAEIDRLIESKQRLLVELESYKKSVIYEYVTGKKEAQQ